MENPEIATFFAGTEINVYRNPSLRESQIEAYDAIRRHFAESIEPCYVQLPVGSGKTGLMGLTPFGVSRGRVLIITPNLTIRTTVQKELDVSKPDCFYRKRGVFQPTDGPFISELKTGANMHDCDNAHIVVANIQQFGGPNNRWYERLGSGYFDMILVDEGHHNVATSWTRLFDYFRATKVVSYTATPVRSDGQMVSGKRIYSFGYTRSMLLGYISPVDAIHVKPATISFTARGVAENYTLDEVLKMREQDWFSRGIALSNECNRHIVVASIRQLAEVTQYGAPRQIIAAACSIRHAKTICALYHEYGLQAAVLHSEMKADERDRIESQLRSGQIDVVVQVQMLGEGYDLGTLSVAAVFRPYRTLSPYIQFVGRILRLADSEVPHSPANQVYVVSHVGLNDERLWTDFTNFDKEDQKLFSECLAGTETEISEGKSTPRMTLRPFMRVLNETVSGYLQRGYLKEVDDAAVHEILAAIRSKGYDPSEFGLTEEMMRARLQMAAHVQREVSPLSLPIQPQRKKEALRMLLRSEASAIADAVVNRLGFKHGGRDLLRLVPGRGETNIAILITLAQVAQNDIMGVSSGERDGASIEQLQKANDASADIVDSLTKLVRSKHKAKGQQGAGIE